MKKITFLIIWVIAGLNLHAQLNFLRYTDFHIHPTYKHYFRPRDASFMLKILEHVHIDPATNTIIADSFIRDTLQKDNWLPYVNPKKPKGTTRSLTKGVTSDLRNYDQASYPEIMFVPGSILCNSYSPYEKQFTLNDKKNQISSTFVTKMGYDRLHTYGDNPHTPFSDFKAEYFYNYLQEEERFISATTSPHIYNLSGQVITEYRLKIKMVKNAEELASIVKANDLIYANWKPGMPPPLIVTL